MICSKVPAVYKHSYSVNKFLLSLSLCHPKGEVYLRSRAGSPLLSSSGWLRVCPRPCSKGYDIL